MPTPLYYPPTTNGLQKTLDANLLTGVTASATLNNVTGIQNKKGLMVIDRVDGNNNLTPNKREYISFDGTSGSTVVTLVRGLGGSTDQDHAVGAIVEFVSDVVQQQAIIDGLLNTITTDGALDTTKVVDLTTAQTITNKTLTSPLFSGTVNGWTSIVGTFTYASAATINVASGAASIYSKGDKLRFQNNDSGTWLYVYVITVADTLLTVVGDTVPNATLTDAYYSHQESPLGFPDWFAWTPSYAGFSSNPTINCQFSLKGRNCFIKSYPTGAGTSNATSFTISLPIAPSTNGVKRSYAYGWGVDNGSSTGTTFKISGSDNATSILVNKGFSDDNNSWTNSGDKYAYIPPMFYEIA